MLNTYPEISVIVCAHNPRADYLARVLIALGGQTLPKEGWELLLVDNASSAPLCAHYKIPWHPTARWIREERLGLTPARLRGIQEAKGDLLVFVDDDNLLDPKYLEHALRLSGSWTKLGAWGGTCKPEFEEPPTADLVRRVEYLALRDVKKELWSNFNQEYKAVPVGAGMCIRRSVAKVYREAVLDDPARFSLGRKGQALTSGEDLDLALTAHDLGLGTGLFPELVLTHLIPAHRVRREYLVRLCESLAYSEYRLRALREPPKKSEFYVGSDVVHRLKLCLMNQTDRCFAAAYRQGRKRAENEILGRSSPKAIASLQHVGTQTDFAGKGL